MADADPRKSWISWSAEASDEDDGKQLCFGCVCPLP